MRKEQFISFIDSPALQQGESVAQLSQLTKQFPYCQTAHLLLAKALHNENSIAYSDQLKTAAAYASDRKVLYQLIMSKAPLDAPAAIEKKETPAVTFAVTENDTELLNNLLENERSETSETEKKETSETEKKETSETEKKEIFETQKKESSESSNEGIIEAVKEEIVEATVTEEKKEEVQSEPVTSRTSVTSDSKPETRNSKLETPDAVTSRTSVTSDAELDPVTSRTAVTSDAELDPVTSRTSVTSDTELETRNPKLETVNVDEISLLEKNILVEAIDASIELEVSENMPFRETEETIETERSETFETEKKETLETPGHETVTSSASRTSATSVTSEPELETRDSKLETRNPKLETTEEEEELDPNKTYSFAEWLRLSQKAKAKSEGPQKPEEKEKASEEKEKQPEAAEKQPEEKEEPKIYKRKTLDDLIDKFISEEPKISRPTPKQEFFSPVNMARQSVQDDHDFVTETLANVYLKQGSFAKAIKAYETLSLKFPEKKLYFAARIKEIKKIIKEQK